MKKILTAVITLAAMGAHAQETVQVLNASAETTAPEVIYRLGYNPLNHVTPKDNYINISWVNQKIDHPQMDSPVKSKEGGAIEFGRTFFFNRNQPVLTSIGAIRFGADLSYMDATYATFEFRGEEDHKVTSHFANIGMQMGPSITLTPTKKVNIKLYGHYAPSIAALFTTDKGFEELSTGYAGYITGGLQASYKFITLGVELRGSTAKLSTISEDNLNVDEEDSTYDPESGTANIDWSLNSGEKVKVKLPGMRITFGFRF